MHIYVAQVKQEQGEGFSIRAFQTKAAAVKAVKTAQATLQLKMEYNDKHVHVDADGFGVACVPDPAADHDHYVHKKEKVTMDDSEAYYVTVYGKDGEFYYRKLAGYIKKTALEC